MPHIIFSKTALTRAINDYASKKNLLKNVKIDGNDVREGITAIISLFEVIKSKFLSFGVHLVVVLSPNLHKCESN